MEVKVLTSKLNGQKDQALALTFFEEEAPLKGFAKEADSALSGAISKLKKQGDLTGKSGQVVFFYPNHSFQFDRLLLVGLGKRDKFELDQVRQAAGRAVQKAKELKLSSVTFAYPDNLSAKYQPADVAQVLTEGASLGNYNFDLYKTADPDKKVEFKSFAIYSSDSKKRVPLAKG